MSDLLNQNEVEALLASVGGPSALDEGSGATRIFSRKTRTEVPEVKGYDFKRPERVSKDQMRALQTLHEGFARNFGASLSGSLRTIVEVKVAACEQLTFAEFTQSLSNPTSFNLIESTGLEGQICLEISPLIIYPIIDRLLGGNSAELFIPERPMTLIETRLIGNVIKRGLTALSEAWASLRKLDFNITATESNPQLVQIVPPNEVVVVIGFELKLSNRAGTMNLCIPYNVIEPVMAQLSNQSWFSTGKSQRTKEVQDNLQNSLGRAPVEVQGILATTTITLRDLLQLSPGDLITTERGATQPVMVNIEGERKFLAQIGQFKGQRALRITRAASPHDRD